MLVLYNYTWFFFLKCLSFLVHNFFVLTVFFFGPLYSALPERSGACCWNLVDQHASTHKSWFRGGKRVQKNEPEKITPIENYLQFIHLISFLADFQKSLILFGKIWKNLESIAWDVREMIINENFLPKWNIGSQWSAKQGQHWKFSALTPFGTPKFLTPQYPKSLAVGFLIFFFFHSFQMSSYGL
jgi:hypothetical protein